MLLDLQFFGSVANGYTDALNMAYEDFLAFCRQRKVQSSQKRFSVKSLVRDTSYGFYLNCKGFNARLVAEWLTQRCIDVNGSPAFSARDERSKMCEATMTLALFSAVCTFLVISRVTRVNTLN